MGEGNQSYQSGTVGTYTTCQVSSCIAGYYKDPNTEACIQVGANSGKYSLANDATLHDCSVKPANSDWLMGAGADDSGDCNWNCDGDYTEDNGTCHETNVVCDIESGGTKIGTGTKTYQTSTDNYSACGSATDCETGYVNDSGNCRAPSADGKYADTNDAEKSCPAKPGGATWVSVTGGMTQATACDFTCPTGEIKTNSGSTRTCASPGTGVYVVNGVDHNCWASGSNSAAELTNRGGASGWVSPQPTTVITAADCQLVGCTANGKVLNAAKTQCVNLPNRHYKDPATQQAVSCGTVHTSVSANSANGGRLDYANQVWSERAKVIVKFSVATDTIRRLQLGASTGETAAECEQECSLGSTPDFGHAPANSGRFAWDSSKGGGAGWSATCTAVVCNAGYDDDDDDNTCEKTDCRLLFRRSEQIRQEPNAVQMEPQPNLYQRMDASWLGTGLVNAGACRWTCNSGHHISSDSTSCTSNDCSSEINDGAGERTSHSNACQVTSCGGGLL